jgi:hypothetical protein
MYPKRNCEQKPWTSAKEETIRVVTYNLLSDQFCTEDNYPSVEKSSLEWMKRWRLIKNKIIRQMKNKNIKQQTAPDYKIRKGPNQQITPQPIFCFQEVSLLLNNKLTCLFSQNKYFYIFTPYEGQIYRPGYMGIAIAFPSMSYCLETLNIFNLASTKFWPKYSPVTNETDQTNDGSDDHRHGDLDALSGGGDGDDEESDFRADKDKSDLGDDVDDLDLSLIDNAENEVENERRKAYWRIAQRKKNQMIFIRLCPRQQQTSYFCIATYHMPSAFKYPEVMLIHTKLLKNKVTSLAGEDPFILAGDFNFEPTSPSYSLLTTCAISPDHLHLLPVPIDGIEDRFEIIEAQGGEGDNQEGGIMLHSAYVDVLGKEPLYTNYAHPSKRNSSGYCGTLDYLFYDRSRCHVQSVLCIPPLDHPIPSGDEPSDHVMIGATFSFKL